MRYFLDTEFDERGRVEPIKLVSIGIVAEDGRELYRENSWFWQCPDDLNPWLTEHVLPHLVLYQDHAFDDLEHYKMVQPLGQIARDIRAFIGDDAAPEFWGYYCQFDFVVLQQLFGDMSKWPQGWPMYCNDLRAWLDWEALNHVEQPDDAPHNALADARWIAQTFREHHR